MKSTKKTAEIKHLGLRLSPALHRELVRRAQADRRSLSTFVIILLERALKKKV